MRLALYVNRYSMERLSSDSVLLSRLIDRAKEMGFQRLYLENYRDGVTLRPEVIERLRDALSKDFDVQGGLAIGTWGQGMGRHGRWQVTGCVSDRRNTEVYVKAMAELAGLFDTVLIDDFWANWCVDDIEGVEEGDLLLDEAARLRHAAYSSELLYRASEEVVRAAMDVNPRVRVVLKVAEWREQFYLRGLDIGRLAGLFDGIYVGTESREGTASYGSLVIVRLVNELSGGKVVGAWFDSYSGYFNGVPISVDLFRYQLRYSALSGVEEVTLYQGTEVLDESRREHVRAFTEELRSLRPALEGPLGQTLGVKVLPVQTAYPQPHDDYAPDLLAEAGVPLSFGRPGDGDCALITEGVLDAVDLRGLLEGGVSLVVTGGALARAIRERRDLELLGLRSDASPEPAEFNVIEYGGLVSSRSHRRPWAYPVLPALRESDLSGARPLAYGVSKGGRLVLAYEAERGRGHVYALPLTGYMYYFTYHQPEASRQVVRDVAYGCTGLRLLPPSPSDLVDLSGVTVTAFRERAFVSNENRHWVRALLERRGEGRVELVIPPGRVALAVGQAVYVL